MKHNIKLLSNTPIGEDHFASKSQENIALSITEIIKNKDTRTGIIGIDGSWGTGKSNLVSIIKKKLNPLTVPKEAYPFFVYDAWGHQEDLQRRAIIEELSDFVCEKYIKKDEDKKCIKDEKKAILGTFTVKKTKAIPEFSWSVFLIVCSIVSTPVANFFVSQKIDLGAWAWVLGWLPVWCIVLAIIIAGWSAFKQRNEGGFFSVFKSKLINIYKKNEIENTVTEYTNLENPSTVSFRKFIKLINKNLPDDKILIVVIDNLDRLAIDKVKELWSTIHVCFAGDEYFEKIRVIVPFDRNHIQAAFLDEKATKSFADDFINKTFNIVFRVSFPVLTDWEKYFKEQWEKAFGTLKDDEMREFDRVKRIYDALTPVITPRDIIAFINECVAIKLSNVDETIKLRYIAIFIKAKNSILADIVKSMEDHTYLGSLEKYYENDLDLDRAISALAYQVSMDKGLEVAITRRLKTALENNDFKEIVELNKVPSFDSVLGEVLMTIKNVENAVLAIDKLNEENFVDQVSFVRRWENLYSLILKHESGKKFSKVEEYQLALLRNIPTKLKEKYTKILLDCFYEQENFDATLFAENIDRIKDEGLNNSDIDVFGMLKSVDVKMDNYIKLLNMRKSDVDSYKLQYSITEMDGYLSSIGYLDLENISFVPLLIKNKKASKSNFPKYINHLKAGVSNISSSDYNVFKIIIEKYKEVLDIVPEANIQFPILCNFFSTAQSSNNVFRYDLISIIFAKHSYAEISGNGIVNTILGNEGKEDIDGVTSVIQSYIDFGNILLKLKDMHASVFYKKVCRNLMDYDGIKRANIKTLIPEFLEISTLGEIDKEILANKLSSWNQYISFDKLEDIKTTISLAFLRGTLEISKTEFIQKCQTVVLDYLQNMNTADWQTEIVNGWGSYEIQAGQLLNFSWNVQVLYAIKNVLIGKIKVEEVPTEKDRWYDFVKQVEETGCEFNVVAKGMYEQFMKRAISINEFKFYSKWLFDYALDNPAEETLRHLLPADLLNDNECREIICDYPEKVKQIYDVAKDEKTNFENMIKTIAKEDDGLQQLAELLGIEYEKAEIIESAEQPV